MFGVYELSREMFLKSPSCREYCRNHGITILFLEAIGSLRQEPSKSIPVLKLSYSLFDFCLLEESGETAYPAFRRLFSGQTYLLICDVEWVPRMTA